MLSTRALRTVRRRIPSSFTRSCSSWGRGRRPKDGDNGERHGYPRESPDSPHNTRGSRADSEMRERFWKEHMKEIERFMNENPYEALFGTSNRRLRGFETTGWPFDAPNWWNRDIKFNRAIWKSGFEIVDNEPQAAKITNPDIAKVNDSLAATAKKASPSNSNEASVDQSPLEYDPISNRMVPRGDAAFSHYGQDLDAAVDVPVKPCRPNEVETTGSAEVNSTVDVPVKLHSPPESASKTAEQTEDTAGIPWKSYRPLESAKREPDAASKSTPSFTMLKEEPSESQPRPTKDSTQQTGSSADVRAEYDQYKARRLPDSSVSGVPWLEQEGFGSSPRHSNTSPSSYVLSPSEKSTSKRVKLEHDFDEVHSSEKEMAQDNLINASPWKVRKSKGTSLPESKANPVVEVKHEELVKPSVSEKSEIDRRARREIFEYNLDVAKRNLETVQRKATVARMDKFLHGIPILEPLWKQVSSEIVKDDILLPEKKIDGLETSLQRHASASGEDAKSLQTALQRHNKSTSEIVETNSTGDSGEVSRTHDPVGYNHARESLNVDGVANMPLETPNSEAETAEGKFSTQGYNKDNATKTNSTSFETESQLSALHEKLTNQKLKMAELEETHKQQLAEEQATLQRQMDETLAALEIQKAQDQIREDAAVNETEVEPQTETQNEGKVPTDPQLLSQAGGLHQQAKAIGSAAWEAHMQAKLAGVRAQVKDIQAKKEAFEARRRVPSLAEMFGYSKKKQPRIEESGEHADAAAKRAEVEENCLKSEIEKQKAAMRAIEEKREKIGPASKADSQMLHQQEPRQVVGDVAEVQPITGAELVKEIRGIYENTYGQITTKHRQGSPSMATAVEDVVETRTSASTPSTHKVGTPAMTSEVAEEFVKPESEESVESVAEKPMESILETPVELKAEEAVTPETAGSPPAVTYTVLAYDPQIFQVTKATLSSPPPNSKETAIPLTVALKGLDEPAKFLPFLQSLRAEGFTPISAERNILILRQLGSPASPASTFSSSVEPTPSVSENDETAGFIDEPVIPSGPRKSDNQIPFHSTFSRPRRLEPVFSGRSKKERRERKHRRRRFRRAFKTVMLVTGAAAATVYVAGVMDEMKRVVVTGDERVVRRRN